MVNKSRLLIIECNIQIMKELKDSLIRHNYKVKGVYQWEKARAFLKQEEFDLILLDIFTCQNCFLQVSNMLQSLVPDVPIILLHLGGNKEIGNFQKYKEHNSMIDYIKIPIEEPHFISRIESVVKTKRAENKLKVLYNELLLDIQIASEIQNHLLPNWFFTDEFFYFSAFYEPSQKIGGDVFDVVPLKDGKYAVYMGDISGHGVQAGMLMMAVKSIMQMLLMQYCRSMRLDPHLIVNQLNRIITKNIFHRNYITMLLAIIDKEKKEMRIFNAGHPPLLIGNKRSNQWKVLQHKGSPPLGWNKESYTAAQEDIVSIRDDEVYVFYTDGIFECTKHGTKNDKKVKKALGLEGLIESFEKVYRSLSHPSLLPHAVKSFLKEEGYRTGQDDFSIFKFEIQSDKNIQNKRRWILSPNLHEIGNIGKEVRILTLEWGGKKDLALKIEICVIEFLNNIILHGSKEKKRDIVVEFCREADTLLLYFFDKGVEWDLEAILKQQQEKQKSSQITPSVSSLSTIKSYSREFYSRRIEDVNFTVISFSLSTKK